jgi:hypothetical protein
MSVCANPRLRSQSIITHESVNFSPSKQKYSFGVSKQQRFSIPINGIVKSEFNYDLPSSFRSRRASFGVGDRFKQATSSRNCKYLLQRRKKNSYEVKKNFRTFIN